MIKDEVKLFHIKDMGEMVFIRKVSLGCGEVNLYKCEKCGVELDESDYEHMMVEEICKPKL